MEMGGAGRGEQRGSELEAFLSDVQDLVASFGERAAGFAQDVDSRPLAGHLTGVLTEQLRNISPGLLTAYREGNDSVRSETDELLRISAAPGLVSGAKNILPGIASPLGLSSLSAIFELIKKIIGLIVGILHNAFLNKWWHFISDLLDEIWKFIVGLFHPFGAMQLHRQQVEFLETQYHLARLTQVKESGARSVEQSA